MMLEMIIMIDGNVIGTVRGSACGSTAPDTAIRTSDSVAYVHFRTNSPRSDIRFQLNFSSSVEGMSFAAFHWARKVVFSSFPVGNIAPLKSEVVFPSGKLGVLRAPRLPTRKYELGNTSFRAQWNAALVHRRSPQ